MEYERVTENADGLPLKIRQGTQDYSPVKITVFGVFKTDSKLS
jgi:hypothetical protein